MTQVVLIPVDFSPPSLRALQWAAQYAETTLCELHLLYVFEKNEPLMSFRSQLARINRAIEDVMPAKAERHVVTGRAGDKILEFTAELRPDLIVMGTHGHGAIARALLGSVAQKVVRDAPCPVVCVKALQIPRATARDAA